VRDDDDDDDDVDDEGKADKMTEEGKRQMPGRQSLV
jgi:hypothetical protein